MEYEFYPDIRKQELYLMSRAEYEKRKLITTEYARRIFKNTSLAAAVLTSLSRKGRLIRFQRGKYFLVPIKAPNQQWAPNEFVVASLWMGDVPYYVGYFTMYHYWGFTEQMPQTVYILNTKRNEKASIGNTAYKAMKVGLSRIYGFQEILIEGESIKVSDRERTLVDFIHRPIGSSEDFLPTIERAVLKADPDKLVDYLAKFPIVALRKRAGYYLEECGFSKKHLDKLRINSGNPSNYVLLEPGRKSRKGKIDKGWGVIVNQ